MIPGESRESKERPVQEREREGSSLTIAGTKSKGRWTGGYTSVCANDDATFELCG